MISAVWLCVASLYSVDFVHSRLKSSGGRFFRPVWLAFSAGLWIVAMLLLSTLKSHSGILSLSLFYGLGYLLSRSGFFGRYGKLSVVAVLFFAVLFVSLNLAGLQSHVGFLKAIGGSCVALVAGWVCMRCSAKMPRLKSFLVYVGKNALAFYAIHWCLFFWIPDYNALVFLHRGGDLAPCLCAVGVFVAWVAGCCVLTNLFMKSVWLRRLFLGEK